MGRVFGWLALCWASLSVAATPSDAIDAFIAAELPASGAPGIAYAVVEDGEVWAGAQGEVLTGGGVAVTPDTPFRIGSITKSLTAVAVMQLVEAGRLGLDDEISRHLAPFGDSPGGAITIRQLLSHTSGYSTQQGNVSPMDATVGQEALSREVAWIATWTPAHEAGDRWDYSNANYLVLGALIEAVSGQDYGTYLTTRILEPLGMTHSFVADDGVHPEMAVGHRPWFGTKRPFEDLRTRRVHAPAGGVVASARDTARYLGFMMNGEDDLLRAETKAEMMRPASPLAPHYGLGWGVDPAQEIVFHSGTVPGIDTLAVMLPQQQRGVVILVNGAGGLGLGETAHLFAGVQARALGLDEASESGRGGRVALFGLFVLSPILFVLGTVQAGLRPEGIRAKSGASGAFSLWFPLLMTLVLAWVSVWLIPSLFGVSIPTLLRFQPDFALGLVATAVSGVVWSVFRLGVHYSRARVA